MPNKSEKIIAALKFITIPQIYIVIIAVIFIIITAVFGYFISPSLVYVMFVFIGVAWFLIIASAIFCNFICKRRRDKNYYSGKYLVAISFISLGFVILCGTLFASSANGITNVKITEEIPVTETSDYIQQGYNAFIWSDGEMLYDYFAMHTVEVPNRRSKQISYKHYYVIPLVPSNFNPDKDYIAAFFAANSNSNSSKLETLFGTYKNMGSLEYITPDLQYYEGMMNENLNNFRRSSI